MESFFNKSSFLFAIATHRANAIRKAEKDSHIKPTFMCVMGKESPKGKEDFLSSFQSLTITKKEMQICLQEEDPSHSFSLTDAIIIIWMIGK